MHTGPSPSITVLIPELLRFSPGEVVDLQDLRLANFERGVLDPPAEEPRVPPTAFPWELCHPDLHQDLLQTSLALS
jgi:hypothetical protein